MVERHPDRMALEQFSRGEASGNEERWVEDHLRSGCAVCQREVDALLVRMLGPDFAPPAAEPDPVDAGWDRLVALLEKRLAVASAERREAPLLAPSCSASR